MNLQVEFFLFYGSIYTYLAAMRVEQLASKMGINIHWCPFNLREILLEQDNLSFARNPVRMQYCWRDVERRAARHGLPFMSGPPYPVDPDLLALRVGMLAQSEGWCAEYTKATYRAWFLEHRAPGVGASVEHVLKTLGKPAEEVLARAELAAVAAALGKQTERARRLGIFGSPTFAIGEEIFWGDDRLEEALEYATKYGPAAG